MTQWEPSDTLIMSVTNLDPILIRNNLMKMSFPDIWQFGNAPFLGLYVDLLKFFPLRAMQ